MVRKTYTPNLKPILIPSRVFEGEEIPAQIRITGEGLELLKASISAEDLMWLRTQITSQCICPEIYQFRDTPKTRVILGIKD